MNSQEAYSKLDLARGLPKDRVDSQFEKLEQEYIERVASTQNAKLKQVYSDRLEEIRAAHAFLTAAFENAVNDGIDSESLPESAPEIQEDKPLHSSTNKSSSRLPIFLFLLALLAGGGYYWFFMHESKDDVEQIDPFRKKSGERLVFVNNLNLREFHDANSRTIGTFPTGTRLIYDKDEDPYFEYENEREWRKVKVIHPSKGWDTDEYVGWMAISECGVDWLTTKEADIHVLEGLFIDEGAGRALSAKHRSVLINQFASDSTDQWSLYAEDRESELQKVTMVDFALSSKDCNDNDQKDAVIVLERDGTQKLLVLSSNYSDSYISYQSDFQGEELTVRPLRSSQIRDLDNKLPGNVHGGAYINKSGVPFALISYSDYQYSSKAIYLIQLN
jgi:hypothetical protein